MGFYLSYKQIPEFKDLPEREALRQYRIYYLRSFLHWENWLGLAFFVLCIAIWNWVVTSLLPTNGFFITDITKDILLVLFSLIGVLVYLIIVNQKIRRLYQTEQVI